MTIIEVKQLSPKDDANKFEARLIDSGEVVGRSVTRIFRSPDRLYLSRIDSYLPGLEIGTAVLLAAVVLGIDSGLRVLVGGFDPDFRPNRGRGDLERWYRERNIVLLGDGHYLSGVLPDIASACRGFLVAKSIDCRMIFV